MRKKFTMLLAALLAVVGVAKAQPAVETSTADAPKYYVIASYNRGGVLTNAGVDAPLTHVDLSDAGYWYFEQANDEGGVHIVNKEKDGENKVYVGSELKASTTAAVWYILANGVNNAGLSISKTAAISSSSCIDANNHNTGVGTWKPSASDWNGTTWVVSEEKNLVDVVYNFTYGETDKGSETAKVVTAVGYEFPAVTTSFPFFGISVTKPAGNIAEADAVDGVVTKTIALEENLPFTYATDVNSVTDWYHLIFHATAKNYLYYVADDAVLEANMTAVDANDKDAYTWAFVGNPFDGFKIYNKKAEKYLSAAKDGAVVSSTEHTFTLTSSTYGENGFYMASAEGENTQRFNKQSGKVVYWSGADAGSTFMVELRDDSEALVQLVALAQELLTNLGEGTTVGCVTAESKTAVSNAIANANTALNNKTGYIEAQAALQAAIDNVVTIQPEAGKFYTIQNAYSNVFMGVGNEGGMVSEDAAGIGEVFQFVTAEDGKFYLKNVERGTFLSTAPSHAGGQASAKVIESNSAKAVAIANLGMENRVSLIPVGGTTLHHDANYSTIVGWAGDANSRSAWKIEEVDITALSHTVAITDVEWATLVLGYDAVIPADVKAYIVESTNATHAILTEVTGTIPAYEAVLLNGAKGSYEFKLAESATAVESNLLKGSTINTYVTEDAYVLSAPTVETVGLYKAAKNQQDNTAFLNNSFKAYLVVEGAQAPMFSLTRDGETGIATLQPTVEEVVIYDLTGRRVEKMEKGIYIVNGKKIIK